MSQVFVSGKWLPYANIKYTPIVPSLNLAIQTCCFAKYLGQLFSVNGVSFCQYFQASLRWLLCQRHNEPGSFAPCATPKAFISLDSWGGCWDCHPGPLDSVCAYIQMVCRFEVKRGCRGGESELFAHVPTSRMDEDTDGISLWWTFLLT